MKKGYQYEINHLTNTVTVTKGFMQNSAYLDTKEYKLMKRFLYKEAGFSEYFLLK